MSRRKALVTGGGRGLGRALVIALATSGYDVIAGVRRDAEQIAAGWPEALQERITVQHLDMAAPELFPVPERLDVLINNAGYRGAYLPIEKADMAEWKRTFDVNFFGVVALTQHCLPALRKSAGAVICNIGSMGVYTPFPFYSTYRCSKAALAALSEGLRIELAPMGIRVMDIPIGGVDTDMLRTSIRYREPEAAAYEAYQDLAGRQMAMQKEMAFVAAAADEVATNIVAELDRAGPLRRPCDPNAVAGLDYVEKSTEEQRALAYFTRMALTVP